MRIQLLAAAAVTTGLLLTTGAALAHGDRTGGRDDVSTQASARSTGVTGSKLHLVEHADTDTTTDTGAKGDSVGDVLSFDNPIYNATDVRQVGSDNGFCIRTKVGAAYECTWTTKVNGGSLTVSGPFYDAHDSVLAVVGGTGPYAGARGIMRLHARDAAGTAYDFLFHVHS